jgi:hypothetical protein
MTDHSKIHFRRFHSETWILDKILRGIQPISDIKGSHPSTFGKLTNLSSEKGVIECDCFQVAENRPVSVKIMLWL